MEFAHRGLGPYSNLSNDSHSWFGFVIALLFLAIVAALSFYLIRTLAERNKATAQREPLDIAKVRYAKGEITREELATIRKELK